MNMFISSIEHNWYKNIIFKWYWIIKIQIRQSVGHRHYRPIGHGVEFNRPILLQSINLARISMLTLCHSRLWLLLVFSVYNYEICKLN